MVIHILLVAEIMHIDIKLGICDRTRSLLFLFFMSLSFKNFNVAHYSKSIKGINTKLGILAHHDKMQLLGKGHNSESYISRVMPLFK